MRKPKAKVAKNDHHARNMHHEIDKLRKTLTKTHSNFDLIVNGVPVDDSQVKQ